MNNQFIVISIFIILFYKIECNAQTVGQKKILFDCTHAETSGNGDWCIDADLHNLDWNPGATTGTNSSHTESNPQQYPTPTQTAVTSSTTETYWEGALSAWAIDCVKKGYWVETLPPITGKITYGNSTNAQDLNNYDIFIVDEPNILFTSVEKTAIMNFIKNGGSLFMISDHTVSDRNNDGYDSPVIWNDLITNNTVQNNAFGFIFELQNFSDANHGTSPAPLYNTNVSTSSTDSITHGTFGNVAQVEWSNGTCMTMTPSQNSNVKGHIWKYGKGQTDTAVVCVTSQFGCGRVSAIGDSSPPDDGTGNPSASLYTGYTGDANGNHRPWLMNIVIWLAQAGCVLTTDINSLSESNEVNVYPNPSNADVTISIKNNGQQNAQISLSNINGQIVNVPIFLIEKNSTEEKFTIDSRLIAPGLYYCKVQLNGKISNRKMIIIK